MPVNGNCVGGCMGENGYFSVDTDANGVANICEKSEEGENQSDNKLIFGVLFIWVLVFLLDF